jgi:hypothetical protein
MKAFHYDNLESLKAHVLVFIAADNLAKHLEACHGEFHSRPSGMPGRKTNYPSRSTRTISFRDRMLPQFAALSFGEFFGIRTPHLGEPPYQRCTFEWFVER